MITLSGVSGKGTLLCTFRLADVGTSGQGSMISSALDYHIPPSDWLLPPPDSVWYPVGMSIYGPRLAHLKIGDIQSVDKDSSEWNPCKHSTLKGDALYSGSDGSKLPFWRIASANPKATFIGSNGDSYKPTLTGKFLVSLTGRPCTTSDTRVFSNRGELVKQVLSSNYGGDFYYLNNSYLCANFAPPNLRSALLQLGQLHRTGIWYARRVDGLMTADPTTNMYWFKTEWARPNRATFIRDQLSEYHSPASYTPESSTGYTGYGYLVEANHRLTNCVVTHVRSDSNGRFQVMYDLVSDLEWFGWKPWAPYKGSNRWIQKGLTASILVLSPGLTTEAYPDSAKADLYCYRAKKRAALLYDAKDAASARTAAVRDVQELDSNWIENLAGVKGTMDCINPLLDGYKAVEGGDLKLARKALAGGYLVYKYVIAPDISDTKNLKADGSRILSLATINRFSNERRRGLYHKVDVPVCSTKASLSYFTTLHLKLKSNYFSQVWAALEKLGLDPASGQMWDLVPFSFVVDWFLPVGDSLRNIDAYNSLVINRDLRARIESFKVQWPVEEHILNSVFDSCVYSSGKPIEYSWYDRRIHATMGSIDPIAISDSSGLSVSQMAQGAALLTQMR